MPKKWAGENSKATVARARKADARRAELERAEAKRQEEYWKDDDKALARKLERQEERERKRLQEKQRKEASRQQLAKEMEELSIHRGVGKPEKMTRAQVTANKLRLVEQEEKNRQPSAASVVVTEDATVPENVNRMQVEGEEARSVQEALRILGAGDKPDRHPERRARAAFNAYQERRLPRLKAENPNLRLSQLTQLLKKEWQKSPENPLNQIY